MPADPFPAPKTLQEFEKDPDTAISEIDGGDSPWGDYGRILVNGMSAHLGRKGGENGPILYERTGPFVPPIAFPGISDVIVTDAMKQAMERADFRGLSFRAVILAHIVHVPWHTWAPTADGRKYRPAGGEPENYILEKDHDPALAQQLGTLWEVVTQDGAGKDYDIFMRPPSSQKYVSARARRWFQAHFSRWTSFKAPDR